MEEKLVVYALMVEQQLEGHPFMDVFALFSSQEKAHLEATKRGIRPHNYYVEALEVA